MARVFRFVDMSGSELHTINDPEDQLPIPVSRQVITIGPCEMQVGSVAASSNPSTPTVYDVFLVCFLTILPACAVAQQTAPSGTRQEGVTQRGDHVMGFSHDATTHHFRLLKDGGEIVVTANDPNDKASIDEIRMHLSHVAKMFADGNFNAPMLIHDTNPPGAATMTRLKGQIHYEVSDIDRGAKLRVVTTSPDTTDAVHAFLLFQIVDHKTGDAPTIGG